MKNLLFLFFLLPFLVVAQEIDSVSLARWYRNSYQPANTKSSIVADEKTNIPQPRITSYKPGTGSFLYLPYVRPNWQAGQPTTPFNSPYFGGYYNLGYSNIGQALLAGGINYLVDKAMARKKKKKTK